MTAAWIALLLPWASGIVVAVVVAVLLIAVALGLVLRQRRLPRFFEERAWKIL